MIDGYETLPFNIERGVPQGDTACPYLFILVLEILLLGIPMMECPDHLISTIQENIDRFIFRTNKNPWMAEDKRYLPPNEGGMGAINIKTYANSLRCSWFSA